MITIITKKRYQQMLDECQRMRSLVDSQTALHNDLLRKVQRIEKKLNEVSKENRALRAEINKMKKEKRP